MPGDTITVFPGDPMGREQSFNMSTSSSGVSVDRVMLDVGDQFRYTHTGSDTPGRFILCGYAQPGACSNTCICRAEYRTGGSMAHFNCMDGDYANNGMCDDGQDSGATDFCEPGTDCADCTGGNPRLDSPPSPPQPPPQTPPMPTFPPTPPLGRGQFSLDSPAVHVTFALDRFENPSPTSVDVCTDECNFPTDGDCDDGGPGAEYSSCSVGTDCADCGSRVQEASAAAGAELYGDGGYFAQAVSALLQCNVTGMPPCTVIMPTATVIPRSFTSTIGPVIIAWTNVSSTTECHAPPPSPPAAPNPPPPAEGRRMQSTYLDPVTGLPMQDTSGTAGTYDPASPTDPTYATDPSTTATGMYGGDPAMAGSSGSMMGDSSNGGPSSGTDQQLLMMLRQILTRLNTNDGGTGNTAMGADPNFASGGAPGAYNPNPPAYAASATATATTPTYAATTASGAPRATQPAAAAPWARSDIVCDQRYYVPAATTATRALQAARLRNLTIINTTLSLAFDTFLANFNGTTLRLSRPPTVTYLDYPRPYFYSPHPPPVPFAPPPPSQPPSPPTIPPGLCTNTCNRMRGTVGVCDDGGPGSSTSYCDLGVRDTHHAASDRVGRSGTHHTHHAASVPFVPRPWLLQSGPRLSLTPPPAHVAYSHHHPRTMHVHTSARARCTCAQTDCNDCQAKDRATGLGDRAFCVSCPEECRRHNAEVLERRGTSVTPLLLTTPC